MKIKNHVLIVYFRLRCIPCACTPWWT